MTTGNNKPKPLTKGEELNITEYEARAILFWLDQSSGKWYGGSYTKIEEIYHKLAIFSNYKRKYWRWRKD